MAESRHLKRNVQLFNAADGAHEFEKLLTDTDVVLLFHNAPFDLAVLCARNPALLPHVFEAVSSGRIRDTRVRQELLDIHAGRKQDGGKVLVRREGQWFKADYSLAGLVKLHCGRDRTREKKDPTAWRTRFHELEDVPIPHWPREAYDYVIADAWDPIEVYRSQALEARKLRYLATGLAEEAVVNEVEQVQAAWALHLMAVWGIRTDREAVAQLEDRLLQEQKTTRARLQRSGLLKARPSTAQERREGKVDFVEAGPRGQRAMRWATDKKRLAEYVQRVYERRGMTAPRTAPSARFPLGQVSTDKDTLYQSGSLLLKLAADGGGVDKILTTYLPALKQGTLAPINVRYSVLKNSGRTAAFGEKNRETGEVMGCNIQNLPTGRRVGGVRECFVPRDGYYFVSVDYDTLELRALAQVCIWLFNRSRMAEVINSGRDLHSDMAARMINAPYEQIEKRKKTPGSPEKRARDCAKVSNFGLPGGLGSESLVDYARMGYGVILSSEEAARLKNAWRQSWPEMNQYLSYISAQVGFGSATMRQFWSNRIRGDCGYTEACNTLFQGLAADGAKLALFRIVREMYTDRKSPLFGSRMVAFIHDEFLAEVPIELAHEASYRLAEVAVSAMAEVIPDITITASPALMKRWHKDAAAVHDAKGRLIPWEPQPIARA